MSYHRDPFANLPVPEAIKGFSKPYWVVNLLELFERGAYYGLMAVLARHMEKNLDFSSQEIGLLFSLLMVLLYFVPIVAAALAEKYGYRETLMVAFALMIIGYYISFFLDQPQQFVLTILFFGIGAGAFKPMVSATVAHVTTIEQRNRGYSIYYWLINFGAFLVPLILSFFLYESIYQWAFVVAGSLIIVNLLIAIFIFESPVEADPDKSVKEVLKSAGMIYRDRRFIILLAIYSGFWFMYAMNQSFLPLYLKNFALMPDWFQTTHLAIINPGTIILLGPFLSKRVERFDSLKMMVLGITIVVFGFAVIGFSAGIPYDGLRYVIFPLAIIIFSIGEFITHPNFISYTSKIAPRDKVAIYMGYIFVPIGIGQVLGTAIGGMMYDPLAKDMQQPQIFWAFYSSVGLLTISLLILYHRRFGEELTARSRAGAEEEWEARATDTTRDTGAVDYDTIPDAQPLEAGSPGPLPVALPATLVERLWNPRAMVVVALLLIPLLMVLASSAGSLTYYEDEDEKQGLYRYRIEYQEHTESTVQQEEIADGQTHTFLFQGQVHNLTYVVVEFRYSETDEPGVGQCDELDAEARSPEAYEQDNSTTSGSTTACNDDPDLVLTIQFDNDFPWTEGEHRKAHHEAELAAELDLLRANGTWEIDATINTNGGNPLNPDESEDVEVTFIRHYYEVTSIVYDP